MSWSLAFGGVLSAAGAGCSLLETVNGDQCTTDGDCAARGFSASHCANNVCAPEESLDAGIVDASPARDAADGSDRWACLGHVTNPLGTGAPTLYTMAFYNATDGIPVGGVSARACAKLDPDCLEASIAPDETSDVNGIVSFNFNSGYQGYVRLGWSLSYPTNYYLPNPVISVGLTSFIPLVPTTEFDELLSAVSNGGTPDPTLGHLFISSMDCSFLNAAPGVSFTLDHVGAQSTSAYVVDDFPSSTAVETDPSGEYIVANMTPGAVVVTATLKATGQRIGVASANVTPGTFTFLSVPPSP